jgi:hypothetical protein
MRRVKAVAMAFHNGTRVRPGDVITVADAFKASWAEDVTPAPTPPPVVEAPVVETVVAAPVEEPKRRSPKKEAVDLPDFGGDLA